MGVEMAAIGTVEKTIAVNSGDKRVAVKGFPTGGGLCRLCKETAAAA